MPELPTSVSTAFAKAKLRRPEITALLIDLDGTLVETMGLHYEAYRRVLEALGGCLDRSDFDRCSGPPARITIPRFFAAAGLRDPADDDILACHSAKKAMLSKMLQSEPAPVLPTADFLREGGAGYRAAVVTSGNREGAHGLLQSAGLLSRFETIVSGDDVKEGKPAAEPYKLALAQLGIDATEGLAFEDHPNGITSALAAGLPVIDVTTGQLHMPICAND